MIGPRSLVMDQLWDRADWSNVHSSGLKPTQTQCVECYEYNQREGSGRSGFLEEMLGRIHELL